LTNEKILILEDDSQILDLHAAVSERLMSPLPSGKNFLSDAGCAGFAELPPFPKVWDNSPHDGRCQFQSPSFPDSLWERDC
jgi:hypothetical protein